MKTGVIREVITVIDHGPWPKIDWTREALWILAILALLVLLIMLTG